MNMRFLLSVSVWAALLGAHFAGDLFFRLHERLNLGSTLLGYILHAMIWATLICAILAVVKRLTAGVFLFLFMSHLIIDISKHSFFPSSTLVNIFDQLLHFATIILAFYFSPGKGEKTKARGAKRN